MRPFFIPFFMLIAVTAAFAQSSAAPKETLIEFRAVAWNRDVPKMFYEVEGKERPLPLRRGNITPSQFYAGPASLMLYSEKWADGKREKMPLAEAKLYLPPQKNLVVVWVDKAGHHVATVLPDESTTLAPGQVRFVNVAGRKLAINCNGGTRVCEAGEQQVVSANKGGVGIKVAVEMESLGKWKLALMNAVRVRPNERVTVFIADPSRLALAPEEEEKELRVKPLTLFIVRDVVLPEASDKMADVVSAEG